MPIYSIPTKAVEEYMKLCKAEKAQESKGSIGSYESAKAAGYINAVGDICGNTVAGLIICEVDGILESYDAGTEMSNSFQKLLNGL